ncbi:MAG: hypothetical protein GWP15_01005 [Nitrospirae bacterium]|nr:hypothetical protein [Nitrospirota bacterium]
MDKKIEVPSKVGVKDELKHYHDRSAELAEKGLIEEEDEKEVMAEKDPDKAKVLLLVALEKRHKEARESYLNKASKERQDQVDSGIA